MWVEKESVSVSSFLRHFKKVRREGRICFPVGEGRPDDTSFQTDNVFSFQSLSQHPSIRAKYFSLGVSVRFNTVVQSEWSIKD